MFNFDKQAKCSKAGLDEVLGISLLFSGMSQAINAVGDGVKTGIQNLAEYSNTANTAMSSLMSSMTRLKILCNSIRTNIDNSRTDSCQVY